MRPRTFVIVIGLVLSAAAGSPRASAWIASSSLTASSSVWVRPSGLTSPSSVDAGAAFDRLKALAGEWKSEGASDHGQLSYEVVAGGSTLLERETGDGRPTMLTLYHRDGDRLLLTHYCMAGNQPRMEARVFDPHGGDLRFEFVDGTNLASPAAGHMHSVAIHFVDDNHFEAAWQFVENGRTKMTERVRYARVR